MIPFNKDFSERIIQGDRKAFDELFRLFYSRLCSFANSYLKDRDTAEDMVQDAFLLLWERHDTLRPGGNVQAWLLTVVKNNIINHINRMKRRVQAEQNYAARIIRDFNLRLSTLELCDPEYLFSAEAEERILKAVDALSEPCRQVITMSRFEEMSHKEIAEKLNISVKGVEYHITNALKKLRIDLKEYRSLLFFFV
ncbi:MAG: RNA polymerase sigma-70 factor [Tannerella sp.]|jgi:RNA polymerase sigma-70 factor (ECF subfamily)|nr:RNA polymerase sigma-70 factor [Tannerella sp.]